MSTSKNLSEQLFKPKFDYPETSTLIQRVELNDKPFSSLLDGENQENWYRVLNKYTWHWRGLSLIEMSDVLSRISASNHKRTHKNWIDTVDGYQSGNWIYEFLSQSAKWQRTAEHLNKDCDEKENNKSKQACCDAWLKASLFAGIASYPHYRCDSLANQAHFFALRAYREAIKYSPYQIRELDFKVENKVAKGILHTPLKHKEAPRSFPIIFLCSGLTNLHIDFYRYFTDFLAPNGIGLFTLDTPSIGLSRQFNLTQNTSIIHQAVLTQLAKKPLVDSRHIILMGYRFGANIATRLAYLAPNLVKGVINVAPIVHQFFVDKALQDSLPTMYKDMIVERLGLNNVSNQQFVAELACFSLKKQRLLTRPCSVPLLNIHFTGDQFSCYEEAKLLTSSKKTTLIKIDKHSVQASLHDSSEQVLKWIKTLT